MKAICKYPLNPFRTTLCLPKGSTPRKVHYQNGQETIWIEVDMDPTCSIEPRTFCIVPTGAQIKPGAVYIDTLFSNADANYVWHVYDVTLEDQQSGEETN